MPDIDKLIDFENGDLGEAETIDFIQDGINKGWVWSLQGFYGRMANDLISLGLCHR